MKRTTPKSAGEWQQTPLDVGSGTVDAVRALDDNRTESAENIPTTDGVCRSSLTERSGRERFSPVHPLVRDVDAPSVKRSRAFGCGQVDGSIVKLSIAGSEGAGSRWRNTGKIGGEALGTTTGASGISEIPEELEIFRSSAPVHSTRGGSRSGAGRHTAEHPRNIVKQIRWTDEEWFNILTVASDDKLTPSSFIRNVVALYINLYSQHYSSQGEKANER